MHLNINNNIGQNNPLSIDKPKFLVNCSKCKSLIKENEILVNG